MEKTLWWLVFLLGARVRFADDKVIDGAPSHLHARVSAADVRRRFS